MRISMTMAVILAMYSSTYAQGVVTDEINADFQQISKYGTRGSGFEGFQTYSSGIVTGSQFFAPSWVPGTVTTTSNATFGKGYLFIYDKVRQELFIKIKDSNLILLGDKSQIAGFSLNTDKTHYFVASSNFIPEQKGIFYEVLVNGKNGYSLLKSIKCKFEKANPQDMEKQRLGEVNDAFVDNITYYISYNNGALEPVQLKEKSIRKVLIKEGKKLDEYIKSQGDYTVDENFLTNLINFINQ